MNNAEQGSVQREDCYCVPVYSFWKQNRIDMERVQKACMVISCCKGVKIHCGSQNNTSQSVHLTCSSAHNKTKRNWRCFKLVSGITFVQVRLALSCAQAMVVATVDEGKNTGAEYTLSSSAMQPSPHTPGRRVGRTTESRFFYEGDSWKNSHLPFCIFTVGACKKLN